MKFAVLFFFLILTQSFLLGLFHFAYHEPWRDEVQHLLLAQKNVRFHQLIQALRFEGHPPLLHLIYQELLRVAEPRLVLAIVAAAGYFALGLATFAIAQGITTNSLGAFLVSVAASWSYSAVYELGVVSRGYGLGMAFAVAGLACWVWHQKRPNAWLHALGVLWMVAAVHTSVHAAILSCCFTLPFFIRWNFEQRRSLILRTAVPMGFALICLWLIVRDSPDRMPSLVAASPAGIGEMLVNASRSWERGDHVVLLMRHLTKIFYEYGYPTNWWPTDYSLAFKQLGGSAFMALLAITILRIVTVREYWREHFVLLVGVLFTIVFYDFFLRYLYNGNFRHQLFLLHPLFLFCVFFWLRERPGTVRAGFARGSLHERTNGAMAYVASVCVAILFVFQWAANASALVSDARWPFSATAELRNFIPDSDKTLIAVDTDYVATPLALWLPHAHFYSRMDDAREFSYVVWDRARHDRGIRRANLFQQLCRRVSEDPTQSIYYLNRYPSVERNFKLREIDAVPASLSVAVADEKFRVYVVECPPGVPTRTNRLAKTPEPESDNAVF